MADGDIGSVLDTLEFDTAAAIFTRIVRRTKAIAVICYVDTNSDQKVVTVEVDASGNITNTVKDTLIFNGASAYVLSIAERTPGIYVICGRMKLDAAAHAPWAATISVGEAGQLPAAVLATLKLGTGSVNHGDLRWLTGNIMVEVDVLSTNEAFIRTFECTSLGVLGGAAIQSYSFMGAVGLSSELCKINSGVMAAVSVHTGGAGEIYTFLIGAAGFITTPHQDKFQFHAGPISVPRMIHVSGNIYAITYKGPGNDGFICTVTIDSGGNIGASVIATYEFDPAMGMNPRLHKVSDTIVAVVYNGPASPGFIKTIVIDAAGNITDPYHDTLTYSSVESDHQDIEHMQGDIYLISHKGLGGDGFVRSVDIGTPAAALPKQLMMMGMG